MIEEIKEKLEEQRYLNHYHCQLLLDEIERLTKIADNVAEKTLRRFERYEAEISRLNALLEKGGYF